MNATAILAVAFSCPQTTGCDGDADGGEAVADDARAANRMPDYARPVAPNPTLLNLLRERVLDAELAALLWLLAAARIHVHVVAPDPHDAGRVAEALRSVAADADTVGIGTGSGVEDVLRLPVPLRPATGAVVVLDGRRVAAAHLLRPPLRDAGGHVRPQGPAVLATWDERDGAWEHFAWAIAPEIGAAVRRPAGDVEIDIGRRREHLEVLVASGLEDPERVRAALAGYGPAGGPAAQ